MMHNIDSRIIFAVLLKLFWIKNIYSWAEHDDSQDSTDHVYTNKWVIHVDKGLRAAREIAEKHNFEFHGPVGSLPNLYHLEHKEISLRSKRTADTHHSLLSNHPHVGWVQQQKILSRKRRGYFSDPLFDQQWYLKNTGQTASRCGIFDKSARALDIDAFSCWNRNITGQGVVVSILDDGLEYKHPDLRRNYDKEASYDFNGNDNDPVPRYSADNINKHGTRCAGEVAAEANNGICGAGVAFNAKVGGIRMLDGEVTDAVEAGSLSWKPEHIDIYSSSWGPDDDGRTVDGPGMLAKKAFSNGILRGRKGRGSIFVWATGNGGRYDDYCSCDGYINSIYTISIGAVDNCGKKPWYAEPCPGTFAVTYSSGEVTGRLDKQISTTDIRSRCTSTHTGTSAAAPIAAGIFALVLEANPKLTWRDLQHLVTKTSKIVSPEDESWQKNGAGFRVSSKFGFGALNAGDLVTLASSENWKTAKPQHRCQTNVANVMMDLKPQGTINSVITASGCTSDREKCITKLEHVQVVINLEKQAQRGQLEINLISPAGTKSDILRRRVRDTSRNGFQNWAFLTIFHWGESAEGKWRLSITDHSTSGGGKLKSWFLKFYGTCDLKSPKKPYYNISIDDEEICDNVCALKCPKALSEECFECSVFCDCTIGKCVNACDAHLVTDDRLRHCRRSMDYLDYNYIPNSDGIRKDKHTKPVLGIALSAKFAIICFALIAVSALIAGIAYFASKMPNGANTANGKDYHAVSRYPCSDVAIDADDDDEEEHVQLHSAVKS